MTFLLIPLAGLLSMDRLTAFNFMLSRPLVVSVIIGAAGGNLRWCLMGGIFFELLGLLDLPVGTRISSDDTFGAFSYSVLCVWMNVHSVTYALTALIICFGMMFPVTLSTGLLRSVNKRLFLYCKSRDKKNFEGRLIVAGQVLSFMRGALFYPLGTVICAAVYILALYAVPGHIPSFTVVIPLALMGGYYIGFFNTTLLLKVMLFLSGGLFSWLVF